MRGKVLLKERFPPLSVLLIIQYRLWMISMLIIQAGGSITTSAGPGPGGARINKNKMTMISLVY